MEEEIQRFEETAFLGQRVIVLRESQSGRREFNQALQQERGFPHPSGARQLGSKSISRVWINFMLVLCRKEQIFSLTIAPGEAASGDSNPSVHLTVPNPAIFKGRWFIDLRKWYPTSQLLGCGDASFSAPVGGWVFGAGSQLVNALEEKIPSYIGMEADSFVHLVPWTNQIAFGSIHEFFQTDVICHKYSHIYLLRGWRNYGNSLASVKLLDGDLGKITCSQICSLRFNSRIDVPCPETTWFRWKTPWIKAGGSIYTPGLRSSPFHDLCNAKGWNFILTWARLFNALVETGRNPGRLGLHNFNQFPSAWAQGQDVRGVSFWSAQKAGISSELEKLRKNHLVRNAEQAGFLRSANLCTRTIKVERLEKKNFHGSSEKARAKCFEAYPLFLKCLPVATKHCDRSIDGISSRGFHVQSSPQKYFKWSSLDRLRFALWLIMILEMSNFGGVWESEF